VVHLVTGTGLEHGEKIRCEAGAECVSAEGPCRDGNQRGNRTEGCKEAIHRAPEDWLP
jgi:hypothetical protein